MNKMRYLLLITVLILTFSSCKKEIELTKIKEPNKIIGSWKMVYGETREGDSVTIKDLSNTNFIKIINDHHFAFFNQIENSEEGFYGGGGTYTLTGNEYVEKLDYISLKSIRGHKFSFTIEFKEDTLIQHGLEEVKEANIKRYIVEKYIRIIN